MTEYPDTRHNPGQASRRYEFTWEINLRFDGWKSIDRLVNLTGATRRPRRHHASRLALCWVLGSKPIFDMGRGRIWALQGVDFGILSIENVVILMKYEAFSELDNIRRYLFFEHSVKRVIQCDCFFVIDKVFFVEPVKRLRFWFYTISQHKFRLNEY